MKPPRKTAENATKNTRRRVVHPELAELKAGLVAAMGRAMRLQGLTQRSAAEKTRIRQSRISGIVNGRFEELTVDRLALALINLGVDVKISLINSDDGNGNLVLEDSTDLGNCP